MLVNLVYTYTHTHNIMNTTLNIILRQRQKYSFFRNIQFIAMPPTSPKMYLISYAHKHELVKVSV